MAMRYLGCERGTGPHGRALDCGPSFLNIGVISTEDSRRRAHGPTDGLWAHLQETDHGLIRFLGPQELRMA